MNSLDDFPKIVILRCCRDWPVQIEIAHRHGGRCGLCNQIPIAVFDPYVKPEEGAK